MLFSGFGLYSSLSFPSAIIMWSHQIPRASSVKLLPFYSVSGVRSIFVWNACYFLRLECVSFPGFFSNHGHVYLWVCRRVIWPRLESPLTCLIPLWFRISPSTWVLKTLAVESRVRWLICLRGFPVFPSWRIGALKTWRVVLRRPSAYPSFWTAMAFSSFPWCCYKTSSSKFPTDHYWWMLLSPRHARHSILVIFAIMFFF